MSFGPPYAPTLNYTPFGVFNAIQAPMLLYAFFVIPTLFCLFLLLGIIGLCCLPTKKSRAWFYEKTKIFRPVNFCQSIQELEKEAFKEGWKAFLYFVLIGTPLVSILCVFYGHHPLSFSAYDSPFQALAISYGYLWALIPGMTVYSFYNSDVFNSLDHITTAISLVAMSLYIIGFFLYLFYLYFRTLFKGIGQLIQKAMIAIGVFTVIQPFVFRFLRYDLVPTILPNMQPFGIYNAYYVIAFFVPCIVFVAITLYLDKKYLSKKKVNVGLQSGLFYLSLLAAAMH